MDILLIYFLRQKDFLGQTEIFLENYHQILLIFCNFFNIISWLIQKWSEIFDAF